MFNFIPLQLSKLSSSTTDTGPQVEKTKASHKPPSSSQTKFGTQSLARSVDASSSTKPIAGGNMAPLSGLTVEAVKRAQEVAARMGFHQDPQFAPLINMFPVPATDASNVQKPSKAPVLRLDAQGREIDEHGNAVNMHKHQNLSTLKVISLSLYIYIYIILNLCIFFFSFMPLIFPLSV